jgi:hypothetical protein
MIKKLGMADAILFLVSVFLLSQIRWCATNNEYAHHCHIVLGPTEYFVLSVPITALIGAIVSMFPSIPRLFSTILMVLPFVLATLATSFYIFFILALSGSIAL